MRKIALFVLAALVAWVARRQIARAGAQARGHAEVQIAMLWMLMSSILSNQPNAPVPANTAARVDGLVDLIGTNSGTSSGSTGGIGDIGVTAQGGSTQTGVSGFGGGVWTAAQITGLTTLQSIINFNANYLNDLTGRVNSLIAYEASGGSGMYDYVQASLRPRVNQHTTALETMNAI
jgi:hypothetical protein